MVKKVYLKKKFLTLLVNWYFFWIAMLPKEFLPTFAIAQNIAFFVIYQNIQTWDFLKIIILCNFKVEYLEIFFIFVQCKSVSKIRFFLIFQEPFCKDSCQNSMETCMDELVMQNHFFGHRKGTVFTVYSV